MKARLIGTLGECERLAEVMQQLPDVEVLHVSEPWPARREPGKVRVYLDVRLVEATDRTVGAGGEEHREGTDARSD